MGPMSDRRLPPFTPDLLRLAYAQGYFPMPHPDTGEILWFHPDPRAVLPLDGFHVSRSLERTLKKVPFNVTIDQDFAGVMAGCAARAETWINELFKKTYGELHAQGDAHSVEVWLDGQLVGGVYGVALGGAFFAESKFHKVTDASKVALYHLVKHMKARGMSLLEVQFITPHLKSLGVIEVSRAQYMRRLRGALERKVRF
jgi:leucyl/phenylalanyl-tRNA--protein transferase